MRRVVFNQKGGVGKSTITCNLAAISAFKGRRTLVLDLDPQGNSTSYLLGEAAGRLKHSLGGFFSQMLSFTFFPEPTETFITHTPFDNLDLMASHPELEEMKSKLELRYKMFKLRDALDKLEGYDEVFIDTPPALNFFSRSALIAADSCLIPFDCDDFSRQALYKLLQSVTEIREDHNAELEVEGIVVNQFHARARLPQKLVGELKEEGLPVLDAYISSSVKIRESHERSAPLIHLSPRHKLSGEFQALYERLENGGRDPTIATA
jgi:chromosome partitioning protein